MRIYKTALGQLRAAYRLFDKKERWIKRSYGSAALDCYCLAGALRQVKNGNTYFGGDPIESRGFLMRAIKAGGFGHRGPGVIDFNDHPKTTYSDVRKVLRRAIKFAETE